MMTRCRVRSVWVRTANELDSDRAHCTVVTRSASPAYNSYWTTGVRSRRRFVFLTSVLRGEFFKRHYDTLCNAVDRQSLAGAAKTYADNFAICENSLYSLWNFHDYVRSLSKHYRYKYYELGLHKRQRLESKLHFLRLLSVARQKYTGL